jgi:hypothetical protein
VPLLTPEQSKCIRKAVALGNEGHFKRAVRVLDACSSSLGGVLPPAPSLVELLQQMHPPASAPVPDIPATAPPTGLPISRKALRKAGATIANGACPDLFGFTGEIMRVLTHNDACAAPLSTIVQAMRDGALGEYEHSLINASWLIALDKGKTADGQQRARPIAGSTVLFKLAATSAMQECSDAVRQHFQQGGVQFGVGQSDGVATAARIIQLGREHDPSAIMLKTDWKNAFNLAERQRMLANLFDNPALGPIFRLAHWTYGTPSPLVVRGKGEEEEEGKGGAAGAGWSCLD